MTSRAKDFTLDAPTAAQLRFENPKPSAHKRSNHPTDLSRSRTNSGLPGHPILQLGKGLPAANWPKDSTIRTSVQTPDRRGSALHAFGNCLRCVDPALATFALETSFTPAHRLPNASSAHRSKLGHMNLDLDRIKTQAGGLHRSPTLRRAFGPCSILAEDLVVMTAVAPPAPPGPFARSRRGSQKGRTLDQSHAHQCGRSHGAPRRHHAE